MQLLRVHKLLDHRFVFIAHENPYAIPSNPFIELILPVLSEASQYQNHIF